MIRYSNEATFIEDQPHRIKKRVLRLIDTSGKTDKEIADFIGVVPTCISNWRNTPSNPSAINAMKVIELLEGE